MHHSPCVLVTGGAKRIGNKICRTLHANGFNLLIHYNHSKDDAESLMHELNESRANSAHTIHFDLANVESIKTLDVENINPFGRLDVLVNNASRFYPTPIGRIDINDWDDLFTSNVQGQFFLTQSLIPLLRKSKGNIINIIDVNVQRPIKDHSIYLMAKAASESMTKSLALDLSPDIRVNGISPGAILWPDSQEFSEENKQARLKNIPLNRLGEPADISKAVLFLTKYAPYITGQIINVDGGRTISP